MLYLFMYSFSRAYITLLLHFDYTNISKYMIEV